MRWQEQAYINNKFSALFAVGDILTICETKYEIVAIGNTNVLCINKQSHLGLDLCVSKEKFIKYYGDKLAAK